MLNFVSTYASATHLENCNIYLCVLSFEVEKGRTGKISDLFPPFSDRNEIILWKFIRLNNINNNYYFLNAKRGLFPYQILPAKLAYV